MTPTTAEPCSLIYGVPTDMAPFRAEHHRWLEEKLRECEARDALEIAFHTGDPTVDAVTKEFLDTLDPAVYGVVHRPRGFGVISIVTRKKRLPPRSVSIEALDLCVVDEPDPKAVLLELDAALERLCTDLALDAVLRTELDASRRRVSDDVSSADEAVADPCVIVTEK